MGRWREYLNKDNKKRPGIINNSDLKQKIIQLRKSNGNSEYDNDLGLKDKVDFYILSVEFWKFFYDTFDCDQII
jgi:hypothetical protein